MEISVDIEEVEKFILSDKFRDFILNNSTFATSAFILQTLLEAVETAKENFKETE